MTTTTTERIIAGPQVLRPRQVERLLAAPDCRTWRGRRDRALIGVMVEGGLRVIEAVRLTRENVEVDRGRVRLSFVSAKSRAPRTVTLPPTTARAVRAWVADPRCHRHWLFSARRNSHITTSAVRLILDAYSRAAGLGHVAPHRLRHTCGSMIVRETGNIYLAQRVLGHSSPAVTARYYASYSVRDADEVAAALGRALHPNGGSDRPRRDPRRRAA